MHSEYSLTSDERNYLRELARRYLEIANLPIMEERKQLWYRHNACQGERPLIVMEMGTFEGDMLPAPRCTSPAAIGIERELLRGIVNHEAINDDKVVSPYYTVYWQIGVNEFGIPIHIEHGVDSEGRTLGFAMDYPLKDIPRDLDLLQPFTFQVDRDKTMAWKNVVEEVLGDILPVVVKNHTLQWYTAPASRVVCLMGLEKMMLVMLDNPEAMHTLFTYLRDNMLSYFRWQEREGLLSLNNENDYAGAGSYGFSRELPSASCKATGRVTTKDLWGNLNSQETVGVSPAMYGELVFPYYYDLAKEFGLTYYGCCEPVHSVWKDYVSRLPGLRKVSISSWCDEQYMGEALRGTSVIYSRKPSPNFIGVGATLDEQAFRQHIATTLTAAAGCSLEFIVRDVYTLTGDTTKPGKAVQITRELIDQLW